MSYQDPKEWLADSSMNLLVDYYPEVQFRPYGSGARLDEIIPVLRDLALGYICIYAKGHGGFTTWPSALDTQHRLLAQDMPALFRAATRETGTKLVLYFSGLIDGLAGLRHPDWRTKKLDGSEHRYFDAFRFLTVYANCPHSAFFDEWVSVQLRELIEQYDPDGFWFDGDWPDPCYCPRCQQHFLAETGRHDIWDKATERDDFAAEYARFWNRVTSRWRARVNDYIKSLKPECAYSAGNVSPRREFLAPFDWRSGDFFSPGYFVLSDIARMMRWYATLGVPYDAYVCDTSFTHARQQVRSRTKTLDRMLQESATVAANGGTVGYWTYPLGDGALAPSRMEKARRVREFIRAREEVFLHTQSRPWTAILASDSAISTLGDESIAGAHKALAALHRSPVLFDETGITEHLPYDLIVLPEQGCLDEATAALLLAFVQQGGKLLTSGRSIQSPELQQALGVTGVTPGAVQDGHVILRTDDEPTGIDSKWDRLDYDGAEELYPLYLSWDQFNPDAHLLENNWPMHGQVDEQHPEPAGFPAAITRAVGQGRIVHLCTDLFAQYRTLGDPQMLRWLKEVFAYLQPEPFFTTNAPSWVDVSLREKDGKLLVHFVNGNPGRDLSRLHTDDLWVDEIPEVGPYTIALRLPSAPLDATWEPEKRPLPVQYQQGVARIDVPRFHIHGCAALTLGAV